MENLQADSFARDYHMDAEIAANADGKIRALRIKTIADHGYSDAQAAPSKWPAGLFSICTGSYDMEQAYAEVDAVYTNKPPGGVAYRCSFRVTEAVHCMERVVDTLAHKVGKDPAQLREENFIPKEAFPYQSPLGWEYDSGDYQAAMDKAKEMIGYDELRAEQAEKRARGELMGIGVCSFTEVLGAGPSKDFDILGIKMFDSAEVRVHPTGKAIARFGTKSQGQGHETTYAQIIAEELGLPAAHVQVEEGDTDTAPYGLGTYASRSTPTAGAAGAMAARQIRDKAAKIAAHLLEVSEEDLDWEPGTFSVKGAPDKSVSIQDCAFAAYTNMPPGMEPGLEATNYYDPPNLTFPFGTYICVVDIDRGTGEVTVRRFVAVDDCGNIINPMIVQGQIHGGLTQGIGPALYEEIPYDEDGNNLAGSFMDYLVPTAVETPAWETGHTVTPSPHHPLGAKGVGESATVGAPPAIANAVVDALAHLGVTHVEIPIRPDRVWEILREKGVAKLYLNLNQPASSETGVEDKYEFRFLTKERAAKQSDHEHWFHPSKVLDWRSLKDVMKYLSKHSLWESDYSQECLSRLFEVIHQNGLISYYEETEQDIEKVLNIFIRVNSGGTVLSYSDLLLSMATAAFTTVDAREEVHGCVDELNKVRRGFAFNKDLVLKSCLVLAGVPGIGFKVRNFTADNMARIESEWSMIRSALRTAAILLSRMGYDSHTLTANSVLIPIAHYVYRRGLTEYHIHKSGFDADARAIGDWTRRALLKRGTFGAGLDTTLRKARETIDKECSDGFSSSAMDTAFASIGRPLRFVEEELDDLLDGSGGTAFSVLALLFPDFDLINKFHVDHVFPQARFTIPQFRRASVDEKHWQDYKERRDRVANLQFLTESENLEKGAKLPASWLADHGRRDELTKRGDLDDLPNDMVGFLEWYEARRERMKTRLAVLLGVTLDGNAAIEEAD